MGRRVADQVEAVGVLLGDDRQAGVCSMTWERVNEFAIDTAAEGRLARPAPMLALRAHRQRRGVLTARAVGE